MVERRRMVGWRPTRTDAPARRVSPARVLRKKRRKEGSARDGVLVLNDHDAMEGDDHADLRDLAPTRMEVGE